MQKVLISILLFLISFHIQAQKVIEGFVYNAKDTTAIVSASVYFAGTSIGVATNSKGFFSIEAPGQINPPLIISSLGYKVKVITNLSEVSKENPIFLNENPETLETVLLEADPWTRRKKLAEFKREFFGYTKAASSMIIENEDILELSYSPSKNTLTASTSQPLMVINRYLGYLITYDLISFKLTYKTNSSGLTSPYMSYYEGFAFFEESKKKIKNRFKRRRQRSYEGSILHFMKALRNRNLAAEGYKIFKNKTEVKPYEYFNLTRNDDLVLVDVLSDKLNILYKGSEQSVLEAKGKFSIDKSGNYTPQQNIVLSGSMGGKRLADLLPPDFNK